LQEKFIKNFIQQDYIIEDIPNDCSHRSYARIKVDGDSYIFMDSPPDLEPPLAFVKIGEYLRSINLHAPRIYQQDLEKGWLIIEDLGNSSLTKYLQIHPEKEKELYFLTIDILLYLQSQTSHPELALYSEEKLMEELEIFRHWYIEKHLQLSCPEGEWRKLWEAAFDQLENKYQTIVLRDYHADNLHICQEEGLAQIGIIDFQDALLGHASYDLMSLIEDARREVRPELGEELINYYLSQRKDINQDSFRRDYNILALQRNLKIIGIFMRKSMRDNNHKYLQYIDRVWGYVYNNLQHPILCELQAFLQPYIKQVSHAM